MGIEQRIRAVVEGVLSEVPRGVFGTLARVAVGREVEGVGVADLDGGTPVMRRVQGALRQAAELRVLERVHVTTEVRGEVRERFVRWQEAAAAVAARTRPVEALWDCWILLLGERALGVAVDRARVGRLWERGFAGQGAAGHVHPLTAETLLDGFVYDELAGIHAAYNAAKAMGDAGMMEQVGRAVRWHVGNTQPDNVTNEPWGMAGFAALDETGTFAEQQLQDAVVQLRNGVGAAGRERVAVGLLADAVMTMENG